MTKPKQPSSVAARRAVEQRHDILEMLKSLTPERIADLDRRARFVDKPDGYPRGGGAVRGSDVSRPTEQAVLAHYEVDRQSGAGRWVEDVADPIGDQIRLVLATLAEAAGVLRPVGRWLRHLDAYQDQAIVREHSTVGECRACLRQVSGSPSDRLRGLYCDACRKAYGRWSESNPPAGDPAAHRLEFERQRQKTPEPPAPVRCGHVCCERVHEHEHWHGPDVCPACAAVSQSVRSEAS